MNKNSLKKNLLLLATLVAGLGPIAVPIHAQYIGPEAGQKVAFLGDSITFFGADPGGWVRLVEMALEKNGKKIEVIVSAYPGHTSRDMIDRVMHGDTLKKKPEWMTLSCGVNDVWHTAPRGVPLDEYKRNITAIVDQATASGAKVLVLTATMINEDQANENNQKLIAYNDFLRSLAAERHFPVADLNAAMQANLAQMKADNPGMKGSMLTKDGVHPNAVGAIMMATGVLKAWGFTDAQLAEAKEMWLDLPGGAPVSRPASLTVRQYLQLQSIAADQGQTVEEMLNADLIKNVRDALSPPAPSAPAKP